MQGDGSHAWSSRDALIVDITADQFEDQPQSIIVDTMSNWPVLFRLRPEDQQQPADFERYDKATAVTLANANMAIVDQVQHAENAQ